jgi:hypothetical protein
MYKSTRHSNKMWTYAASSLGPYIGFGENAAGEIISKCRSALIACGVLRLADFETFRSVPGALANIQFVNGRLRSGYAYLRKVGIPVDVLSTIPNWLTIAPKLGKVLHNLGGRPAGGIEADLYQLHRYLQGHIATTRPQFSNLAKRVQKTTLSPPVQKAPVSKRKLGKPARATPASAIRAAPAHGGDAVEAQPTNEQPTSSEPSSMPMCLAALVASASQQSSSKGQTSMALALQLAASCGSMGSP